MIAEFPASKILIELDEDDLLPAILFRTSRRQCDTDVEKIGRSKWCVLHPDTQRAIKKEVDNFISAYGVEESVITKHQHYPVLLASGIGAHHAGQLLMWRLLLEELMSRGVLKLMIATGTVAAGVDFPARTVVITAHSKRGSEGFNVLTAAEFQQMSGRAGRRGKDSVGICLVAPGQFSDARVIHQVAATPPEPLRSAYFAAPASVLNLLKYRNVDDLMFTVSKSLASFLDVKAANEMRKEAEQDSKELETTTQMSNETRRRVERRIRRKIRDAEALESKQAESLKLSLVGLEKLGFISNGSLTEKGTWSANLCTSLVLEIAEAINDGLLYDVSVEQLVGMVAAISGDPHRAYFHLKPNPLKKDIYTKLTEIIERVHSVYGTNPTNQVQVLPDAALTVVTWMDSSSWAEFAGLLRLSGCADGDAARVITQTADHLNQIARLVESHPELARTAVEARKRILKPPLTEALLVE